MQLKNSDVEAKAHKESNSDVEAKAHKESNLLSYEKRNTTKQRFTSFCASRVELN